MPLSFPETANSAYLVGRTPWSAADAPVGLLGLNGKDMLLRLRDAGVPRGPGVRPKINADRPGPGKPSDIGHVAAAGFQPARKSRERIRKPAAQSRLKPVRTAVVGSGADVASRSTLPEKEAESLGEIVMARFAPSVL
jgi:hypothetical protein